MAHSDFTVACSSEGSIHTQRTNGQGRVVIYIEGVNMKLNSSFLTIHRLLSSLSTILTSEHLRRLSYFTFQ